jgi:hypothetical protein
LWWSVIRHWVPVWCLLGVVVQNFTKILVGLSDGRIPPVKIYSNKEFSQLPKFFYETNK